MTNTIPQFFVNSILFRIPFQPDTNISIMVSRHGITNRYTVVKTIDRKKETFLYSLLFGMHVEERKEIFFFIGQTPSRFDLFI